MLENAHSNINRFRAKVVAHKDAVFPRICHGDVVDGHGAALGLLCDGELDLVHNLLVVTKPDDLWVRTTVDEACETQSLKIGQGAVKEIQL